ncbi:MAG: MFS transporter [Acidobacteria bacterium]|nr:MFS transporter [Acidobacteriota bacterium]
MKKRKISDRGGSQAKWIVVALLFLISALNYGDRSALSSILPLLQHEFHLSDIQLGLLQTGFLWTYAIGVLFGGYLGDMLSRSRLITLSLVGWSIATLLAGLCHNFPQLVLCRILLGIAECFYIPAALALIADHHETGTRGTALALNLSGMSVGLIVGAAVSGWLAERYHWQLPFLLLGLSGLTIAPFSWLYVNDVEPRFVSDSRDSQHILSKLAYLMGCRSYLLIVFAGMLASCGAWIFWTWLPLYYHDMFHLSLSASGFSGTFMLQSAAVMAIIVGGYFSDRIGADRPKRRLLALSLFCFCSIPFLSVFYGRQSYAVVSIGIFLSSFIRTFGQGNEHPIICELVQPQLRSTALGVLLAAEMAGGGVAVLFAGYVKQNHGLSFAFLCTAGFLLLAGLSTLTAYIFFFNNDLVRRPESPMDMRRYSIEAEPENGNL